MKIGYKEVEGTDIIKILIEGEIDVYTSIELKTELTELIEKGNKKVVMDLGKVTYMDSSGLGTLVSILQKFKKEDGVFKLLRVTPSIKKIFELTRLTKYFEIYEKEEECIESFK